MLAQPDLATRPSIRINAAPVRMPAFPPRYFHPGEIEVLIALIASASPRTVIEFGCNEGRAAAAILLNLPCIKSYVGIDVLPGYVTIKECQRGEVPADPGRFARDDPRFRLILRANGAFDLESDDLPQCDAAFIDADHSRRGVLNDYALARARLRPGGIVIFHDDNGLPVVEVSETLDELHSGNAPIIHVADTWIAYQRDSTDAHEPRQA